MPNRAQRRAAAKSQPSALPNGSLPTTLDEQLASNPGPSPPPTGTLYSQISASQSSSASSSGVKITSDPSAAGLDPEWLRSQAVKIPRPSKKEKARKLKNQMGDERIVELSDDYETDSGDESVTSASPDAEVLIGRAGESFFYAVPLTLLHLGFDVLVHLQYREDFQLKRELLPRSLRALPVLWLVAYLLHPPPSPLRPFVPKALSQALFWAFSVVAGCYLVYAANEEGYYAVMKRAPPLGTLWIWSVVELEIVGAILSCAIVGGYTWWQGYGIS